MAYLAFVALSKHRTLGYLDVASDWGNGIDGGHAFFAWLLQMLSDRSFLLGIALLLGLALLGAAVGHTASRGYPLPVFVFTLIAVLISLATSNYFGSRPRYLLPVFTLLLWPSEGLARLREPPRRSHPGVPGGDFIRLRCRVAVRPRSTVTVLAPPRG